MRVLRPAQKTYDCLLTQSRRWARFVPRPDDIFICAPSKSGTTWTQAICASLLQGAGSTDVPLSEISPWVDFGPIPEEVTAAKLDRPGRRLLKTHTPADGLPIFEGTAYICIYRHPLDVHFSMRRHVQNLAANGMAHFYPDDLSRGLEIFLSGEADGDLYDMPNLAGILHQFRTFSELAGVAQVHMFHFAELKADLAGTIRRMAAAMRLDVSPEGVARTAAATGFEAMKGDADRFAPFAGTGIFRSERAFFDTGANGKWHGLLSDGDLTTYDAYVADRLTEQERRWIEFGPAAQS